MMKTKTTLLFLLVTGLAVFGSAQAGEMEPPGPPAPTMVTLQQMFDELKSPSPDTCFDNVGRFVDCGNGTVKDNLTGLFWLKNADCFAFQRWATASLAVAQLADGQCGLTDGSKAGDWRLPTLECPLGGLCTLAEATGEFASIFAPACPAPYISDTLGTGCWSEGDPFFGVQPYYYWSSSTDADTPSQGWRARLDNGSVGVGLKTYFYELWPVRGGP